MDKTADEMECPYCAEVIKAEAKKCKHCGEFIDSSLISQKTSKQQEQNISSKTRFGALFWFLFCGSLGAHRFYAGKNKSAILMILLFITSLLRIASKENSPESAYSYFLLTCLIVLVLWIFADVFLILSGKFTDSNGKLLKKW